MRNEFKSRLYFLGQEIKGNLYLLVHILILPSCIYFRFSVATMLFMWSKGKILIKKLQTKKIDCIFSKKLLQRRAGKTETFQNIMRRQGEGNICKFFFNGEKFNIHRQQGKELVNRQHKRLNGASFLTMWKEWEPRTTLRPWRRRRIGQNLCLRPVWRDI